MYELLFLKVCRLLQTQRHKKWEEFVQNRWKTFKKSRNTQEKWPMIETWMWRGKMSIWHDNEYT